MKCMMCGAPATTFISKTVNGKTTQIALCENCVRHQLYFNSAPQRTVKEAICPKCKTRLSEFLNTHYVGCPDCYTAFAGTISKMLPKIQGGTRHIPRGHMGSVQQTKEDLVRELKKEMKKASDEMRYDDAAKIFNKLKEMGEV